MTKYLKNIIEQKSGNLIRIWDSTELPANRFQLSADCVKNLAQWAQGIIADWPETKTYFIANADLTFGTSRMYEMLVDRGIKSPNIVVLKSLDELPPEIREKIPSE